MTQKELMRLCDPLTFDKMLEHEQARRVRKVRNSHPEEDLQAACVEWFRYAWRKYWRLLFAVPNGGSRNAKEAANMKRAGVVAGVADLLLLVPNKFYGALCIEMKVGNNSQSDAQKEWERATVEAGNQYAVCRTLDEFMEVVNEYLKANREQSPSINKQNSKKQ